jgi:transcription initiation factor TFIIB
MTSEVYSKRKEKSQYEKPDMVICPECGGTDIVHNQRKGEKVCTTCGLVISEHQIDQGPEWRAFTKEERDARARTGAPATYTMFDKGLFTTIDWRNRDSSGRKFKAERRAQIYRLRKWQRRSRMHNSSERNIAHALSEMDRIASQLGISHSIKELAGLLYRKLIVRKLLRSRSIDPLAAASIYAACRLRKIPRTLEEVSRYSRETEKKIARHYRMLVFKLNLKMPIPDPSHYVPMLINELNLAHSVQEKTLEILEDAKNKNGLTTGKDPKGIAASAIYIAGIMTENHATQREIAKAADVTEVTIRNRYKELVRELNISML